MKSNYITFFWRTSWCVAVVLANAAVAWAQEEPSSIATTENRLIETYWRYQKTTNLQTDEVIHQSDDQYEYYLHFKFDFSYEQYLNGATTKGIWLVNDKNNELFYNFRNIKWWTIRTLTSTAMVLEFSVKKERFAYTFQNIEPEKTPFKRPLNTLPTVKVNKKRLLKQDADKALAKKEERTKKLQEELAARNAKKNPTAALPPIEIQLIGGGYYGGIDPVLKDYIVIKSSGLLVKEFQSQQKGLIKTTKQVPRADIERLVQFIESKHFFEFDRVYDCTSGDCFKRQSQKPTPVPLRLSVRYGSRYNIVTVAIWGLDEGRRKHVVYPSEIDLIVEGIQKLAGF